MEQRNSKDKNFDIYQNYKKNMRTNEIYLSDRQSQFMQKVKQIEKTNSEKSE